MPNGPVPPRLRHASGAALIALGLLVAGCSSDDAQTTEQPSASDQAPAQATEQESSSTQGQAGSTEAPATSDICQAITSADLAGSFDDQLEFGEASSSSVAEACTVPVIGAEGEGLLVQITTEANYLEKQKLQQSVPYEEIDGLGTEAYLINEADLNVLLDDGTALSAALQVFYLEGDPPPADVIREGLTAVAQAVLDSR